MLKKNIVLAILMSSQVAFAADNSADMNDKITQMRGTIDSINGELTNQRAAMSDLRTDIERSNSKLKKQIFDELKTIQRQNQSLYDSMVSEKERDGGKMNVKPLRNYDLQTPDGKMILGGEEYVYVKEANATIAARIDTGASQSSISASNVTEFERNGKKWLRFDVIHNDRTIEVEAPFVKQTRLRQSSIEGISYRPIVRLNVKIGDYSTAAEFNLIDRTQMQYALLIGRTLLTDIAVVDVSRKDVQPRADKNGLLIICTDDYNENKKNGIDVNEKYDKMVKENKGGQKAFPAPNDTQSLGTNPERSLPSVSNKIEKEQGSLPKEKIDKKKATADKSKDAAPKSSDKKKSAESDSKKNNHKSN